MDTHGTIGLSGALSFHVTRGKRAPLAWRIRNFLRYQLRHLPALLLYRTLGRLFGLVWIESALHVRVKYAASGEWVDYGVVSRRVVTTAGVNKIVALMNTSDAATGAAFKYHALGTGTNAPAIGDTALQTELTTEYAVNNTRPTGTQTTGASNNVYRSVATNTLDGSANVAEFGVLSQAATGGGTLLDRFTFTALALVSGDAFQSTFDLTMTAGG